jgi:SNF family Na+-dependent transporter
MSKPRDFWSSPTGFVLATIGAAVGLGSIWKFPYEVGANGDGAFVLFYLLGFGLIVFPLMPRHREDQREEERGLTGSVGPTTRSSLISHN